MAQEFDLQALYIAHDEQREMDIQITVRSPVPPEPVEGRQRASAAACPSTGSGRTELFRSPGSVDSDDRPVGKRRNFIIAVAKIAEDR